jgi:hypothetical protein
MVNTASTSSARSQAPPSAPARPSVPVSAATTTAAAAAAEAKRQEAKQKRDDKQRATREKHAIVFNDLELTLTGGVTDGQGETKQARLAGLANDTIRQKNARIDQLEREAQHSANSGRP